MTENNTPKQEFVREQIKQAPKNRKKLLSKVGTAALCGVVFALAAGLVFVCISRLFPARTAKEDIALEEVSETETETESESEEADTIIIEQSTSLTLSDYQKLQNELYSIGRNTNKSVVAITSVTDETDWFNNTYEQENSGSGVIVAETPDKYLILTEKNAIPDESRVSVTFSNDVSVNATLEGADSNTGIAILSVSKADVDSTTAASIRIAVIGNSNTVYNGEIVIALGSPLGTPFSILTGNITSVSNEITKVDNNYSVFTTDIEGNAQGSGILTNVDGEVIGLIMQEYNASESNNTLTAVKITQVEPLIDMLMNGKQIPYMGLHISTVTDKIAAKNDIPKGVYIRETEMDSPAMLAGLQSGDIITAVNGQEVLTVSAFNEALLKGNVGDVYKITVQRQSGDTQSEVTCNVTAGTLNR